jgi:hypothetical protein
LMNAMSTPEIRCSLSFHCAEVDLRVLNARPGRPTSGATPPIA